MTYLAFKNWRRFQHYTKRKAPWVKLYGDVLDDADFLALSESAQAHLVKLWALVASMGHPLPNNPALLAGKIGAKRLRLAELVAAGFIYRTDNANEGCAQDASDLLAECEQNAMDSTRAPDRTQKGELEGEKNDTTDIPPKANNLLGASGQRAGAPAAQKRIAGDNDPRPIPSVVNAILERAALHAEVLQ